MASVTFRRRNATATADVWCEREWLLPSTGAAGGATIRLPYTANAASATYIDPDGGSWVTVADEGGCGKWVGIIRRIRYGATEIEIEAEQPWVMLGDRIVHAEVEAYPTALPAGYLAWKVIREAISGVPWFWCRYQPDASDRLLQGYRFDGQDCWSAILDLMEQSNAELVIDAETGEVKWLGAFGGDLRNTTTLIADGNLREWEYQIDGSQRVSEVTVKRGTERYRLANGAAALAYPGQTIITAETGQSLYYLAALELARRRNANASISGGVTPDLWGIRERDFVRVLIPGGKFTGAEHPCRVLGRSVSDDDTLMRLSLQVIDETVGVRVAPPMRATSGKRAGARGTGSWAQRWMRGHREAWDLIRREH